MSEESDLRHNLNSFYHQPIVATTLSLYDLLTVQGCDSGGQLRLATFLVYKSALCARAAAL